MDNVQELEKIEESIQFEDDSNELPPDDVFAFNELRSCADLFRLYDNKILEIHPDFQRDVVWKNTDQTRFVDSLVKNLPIPSLCFSLDSKTGKMQVIDGLQRISAICKFLGEPEWRLSSLDDIDQKISGKTVEEIQKKYKQIYEKVQNVSLPVTLLRCDYSKKSHTEYIFTIFRRLNTGGMKLTNQEIRNAVYAGAFNEFLKQCNRNKNWKKLLERAIWQENHDDRFRSIELVLRFFSFAEKKSSYSGKLSFFLNEYMQKNRGISDSEIAQKENAFVRTVDFLVSHIFTKKSKVKLSAVVFEAVLYGVAKNLNTLELNPKKVVKGYESLKKNEVFETKNISEGLYKKARLLKRLDVAEEVFGE